MSADVNDDAVAARRQERWAAHGFVLACLGAWAAFSASTESYVMPGPWVVAERLGQMMLDVHEASHMFYSFAHIISAVAISFAIGSALAILAHYAGLFRLAVHGRLSPFLNSFSGVGWTFLAIIWFGISDMTVVFVISMVLIPFAIINMREGLENLDGERVEMAASFTRSRWRRFRLIVLPSLLPFIYATIRISFGVAWKVALTAELFGGDAGLGYLLNLARQDFDMPLVIGVIVIIIAFVYLTERLIFEPIQTRLSRHHAPV